MVTSADSPPAFPPSDAPQLAAGTVVEGRYRVLRLIGVGGTGVVYEVEHLRTGQHLALKTLLDPSHAPRLEQEGRALARLRSAHVVKVVDLGMSEAGPYLVMTLLEGKNLRDVLEAKQKLSLGFVANLAMQVCEGLDEAHRVGLVHRDLKPDNIHLNLPKAGGSDLVQATVFDFGVVKVAAADEPTNPLTRTGSTVGTPYYMSLEQLRGSGAVDTSSDIYAFSVVLYECLAQKRPFEAGTLGDLIFAICSTTPQHLQTLRSDLPKSVLDLVMRGLSRQKEERPQSMRELALALQPYADPGFALWLRLPEPTLAPAGPALSGVMAPLPASGIPGATTTASALLSAPSAPVRPRSTQKLQVPEAPRPSGVASLSGRGPATAPPPPLRPSPAPFGAGPIEELSSDALEEPTSMEGHTPVDDAPPGRPDRETPTEMFVRGVHDEVGPEAGDTTAVLDMEAITAQQAAAKVERQSSLGAGGLGAGSGIPGNVSFGVPPSPLSAPVSTASPAYGIPTTPHLAAHGQQGQNASFGKKVDQALSGLGRKGNEFGEQALAKFRALSQEQQILTVVVVTALLAIVVVGLAYVTSF